MSNPQIDFARRFLNLPNLIVEIKTNWGAQTKTYRSDIRRGIWSTLESLQGENRLALPAHTHQLVMDLERTIKLPEVSVSISHCLEAGGFALCLGPTQIGLDIEVADRVVLSVAERVSTPEEVREAPSPAHLWAGKEATFKSLLGPHQPAVLPFIRLNSWQRVNPHSWSFSAEIQGVNASQLAGVVIQFDNLVLGLSKYST